MTSERRAARAGLNRPQSGEELPAWLFERPHPPRPPFDFKEFMAARREWDEARDAWLHAHGLVMWPMGGLSYHEFERIEREEPHRVLRRPAPVVDPDNDPRSVLYEDGDPAA